MKSRQRLEQEWERAVLTGLALEWENGCNELSTPLRAKLRRPTFRLADMQSRWGYWDGAFRQIVISRRLALKYPWDTLREILLHEMAHQVAEQALNGIDQPAHGNAFKQACALLQANPAASGTYPLLEERIRSGSADPRDKLMARVDKLMALAQSSHRHEAESAMLKAHELIAKYNLERIGDGIERAFISAFVGRPALRHYQDTYQLANLVQDCYFVSGIWVPAYVLDKGKMGRVLEISGVPKNVSIARHVYAVLERTIRTEWLKFRSSHQAPASARIDFATGFLDGFKGRIEKQNVALSAEAESKAMLAVEDPQLAAYFNRRYPRTRSFSRGGRQRHAPIESAGNRIGRRLIIAKAVENAAEKSTRMLPAKTAIRK